MIYLIDIDGTIADCSHRMHFIDHNTFVTWVAKTNLPPNASDGKNWHFESNWDAFFKACVDDKPIQPVIELVKCLQSQIVYITGRSDLVRFETQDWLAKHDLPITPLYMRRQGDHRPDDVVKSELLTLMFFDFSKGGTEIELHELIAFEDRTRVVEMYRSRGIRCFQVADGNF